MYQVPRKYGGVVARVVPEPPNAAVTVPVVGLPIVMVAVAFVAAATFDPEPLAGVATAAVLR
jgi:hypothetical protein